MGTGPGTIRPDVYPAFCLNGSLYAMNPNFCLQKIKRQKVFISRYQEIMCFLVNIIAF